MITLKKIKIKRKIILIKTMKMKIIKKIKKLM
jgi:hypothetical protein